jgi:hypothetical protein
MIEVFGEPLGCTMFRKVGPWYAKRFGPASFFNKGIVRISTRAEFHALLNAYIEWRHQFLDADGLLLPKFAPQPQPLNFHQEDSFGNQKEEVPLSASRESIPVPAGPQELW